MKVMVHALLMCCCIVVFASAAFAENDYSTIGVDDPAKVARFINDLQNAINAGDREALANMMSYPLMVVIGDDDVEIKGKEEFIEQYDAIMSPDLKDNIAGQGLKDEDIFVNRRGIKIGGGDTWAMGEDGNVRIFILR